MGRSRGMVSFLILGTGLLLGTFGLLFSYYIHRSSRLESEYIQNLNIRKMVYSVMCKFANMEPMDVVYDSKERSLSPGGKTVTVTQKAEFSTDNNFRVLSVTAETDNGHFGLRNYTFIPTKAVQDRAGSYVFSSYTTPEVSTMKYIGDITCSSGTYFNFPIYNTDLCMPLDLDNVKHYGFGQYIYFYRGNLTIPKGNYRCNSMLIVAGNLTISQGATFTGRMIFLVGNNAVSAGGKTVIGNDVAMDDGLILSQAALVIGSGCRMTGHFRSSMSVTVNGYGTFTGRNDAGRPFESIIFAD